MHSVPWITALKVIPTKALKATLAGARCDPKVPEADVPLEHFEVRRLMPVYQGQAERYPCPLAGVAFDPEAAAVGLDDALGDG